MRRKQLPFFIYLIGFWLVLCFFLPESFTSAVRCNSIAAASFFTKLFPSRSSKTSKKDLEMLDRVLELELENLQLKTQLYDIETYLLSEEHLEKKQKMFFDLSKEVSRDALLRKERVLIDELHAKMNSLQTKVIYKEPLFWNNIVWVNVGTKHNESLGQEIVCKNSPVMKGGSLVGVVEKVGFDKSKVRLLCDSHLTCAVRAVRGSMQHKAMLDLLTQLMGYLSTRDDVFFSHEEHFNAMQIFDALKHNLKSNATNYLAKGEICGSEFSASRVKGPTLIGEGFQYDFDDEEGKARDLNTDSSVSDPIIQKGDLLITTGLDGIFYPGLHVGCVKDIKDLKEGQGSFEISVLASCGSFDELDILQVLPPVTKP